MNLIPVSECPHKLILPYPFDMKKWTNGTAELKVCENYDEQNGCDFGTSNKGIGHEYRFEIDRHIIIDSEDIFINLVVKGTGTMTFNFWSEMESADDSSEKLQIDNDDWKLKCINQ